MIHQAGAKLFYLPSYSPDLNSTEKLWAKVKAFLRKRRALDPGSPAAARQAAFACITPSDCRNWFAYAER